MKVLGYLLLRPQRERQQQYDVVSGFNSYIFCLFNNVVRRRPEATTERDIGELNSHMEANKG